MRLRFAFIPAFFCLAALGVAFAQLRPFREYPGVEYEQFELPPDYQMPAEWIFARLMYPPFTGQGPPDYRYNYRRRRYGNWKDGRSSWTTDYPRADRHLAQAIRRLSRVQVRSVEQPVDLDDADDVFNYPWLYAVEVGQWDLTDQQARKMREYL